MKLAWLIYPLLLTTLVSCGKDNKTGKDNWALSNPYTAGTSYHPIHSPYQYGNTSVNQVMQENPCTSSGQPSNNRIQIQIPLSNFPTVIPANDMYVGVTSYGDVAVMVGQGGSQPPLFVGYMCPRSFTSNGQGYLAGITIGSYSNCLFKPITKATIQFPGGASADFRMLDYGSSMRQKFSFCR